MFSAQTAILPLLLACLWPFQGAFAQILIQQFTSPNLAGVQSEHFGSSFLQIPDLSEKFIPNQSDFFLSVQTIP